MKKKYCIPVVQFVSLGMPKSICDDMTGDIHNQFSNYSNGKAQEGSDWAPARIKLYF